MKNLPNKKDILYNLKLCWNNKEKLIYLIDLGKNLPLNNENIRKKKYIIYKCQSNIWIKIKKKDNILKINGDSDASIIKGIIATIIIAYKNKKIKNNLNQKISNFFKKINLFQKLTLNKLINFKIIFLYIQKKILNYKNNKNLIIQ